MKRNRALLTFGTLAVTFGWGAVAKAEDDFALSFALEPKVQADDQAEPAAAATAAIAPAPPVEAVVAETGSAEDAPLPIPPGAENPPMSGDTAWPAGVYGGVDALAIGAAQSVQELLPAPPPAPAAVQVAAAPPPAETAVPPEASEAPPATADPGLKEKIDDILALTLDLEPRHQPEPAAKPEKPPEPTQPVIATNSGDTMQAIFEGGTDSLVARAVGSAEGTRTPEGHKNPAFYGHVDPGNGVWNMGTFSYQHGARSPEEADEKQLQRLKRQTEMLKRKAHERGIDLSQEELLNGIDLANQAPLAALDRGGYIDWLQEAHKLGMTGAEAIVWARTRSFIDPDTQRWNAPGLGNNVYSISHDQERRANAIARAINVSAPTLVAKAPTPANRQPVPTAPAPPTAAQPAIKDEFALSLEVPKSFMNPSTGGDIEPTHSETFTAQAAAEESPSPPPPPATTSPEPSSSAEQPQASQPKGAVLATARAPFANFFTGLMQSNSSPTQPLSTAELKDRDEVSVRSTEVAALAEREEQAVNVDSQSSEAPASEENREDLILGEESVEAISDAAEADPLLEEQEDQVAEESPVLELEGERTVEQSGEEEPTIASETAIAPEPDHAAAAIAFPEDDSAGQPLSFVSIDAKEASSDLEETAAAAAADRIRIEEPVPEVSPNVDAAQAPIENTLAQPEGEAAADPAPLSAADDVIADDADPTAQEAESTAEEPDSDPFEAIKKSASAVKEDAKAETTKLIESLNSLQTILRQE